MHRQKRIVMSDISYVNALIVEAIKSPDASDVLLADVDFFLDLYFTSISNQLYISQDDLDVILPHFASKIERIAKSNVSLIPRNQGKSSNSKKSPGGSSGGEVTNDITDALTDHEDIEYSTYLAIRAAESLVLCCPQLLNEHYYKFITSKVVNELLLINQHRLEGLRKLENSPYVTQQTRMSLLSLLRSLTFQTMYVNCNPLQIAFALFEKFSSWDTNPDLNIVRLCKESVKMLSMLIRSAAPTSLLNSSCENVIIGAKLDMNRTQLTPIEEEPSSFGSNDDLLNDENTAYKTTTTNQGDQQNKSIQTGAFSTRSESVSSSYYVTAAELTELTDIDMDDSTFQEGSKTVLQPTDMEISRLPTNSTLEQACGGSDRTTFECRDMSIDQSTFTLSDGNLTFDSTNVNVSCASSDRSKTSSRSLNTESSPAKKLCQHDEDVTPSKNNSTSSLARQGTFTLLPKDDDIPLTSEQMVDEPKESIEDILKTAILNDE